MSKTARLSELDALIDDLTVDAYGEEQLAGFLAAPTKPSRAASPRRSSVSKSSWLTRDLTRASV